MTRLFILNESRKADIPGDVWIFLSLDELLRGVEAIDVLNGEYFAFVSDGREIRLHADSEYSNVVAAIEDTPHHSRDLETLLKRYLSTMSTDGRFQIDAQRVAQSRGLEELISLIPTKLIERI